MYEYKTLTGYELINAAELNELGKDGWELVQIISRCEGMKDVKPGQFVIYFRRAKKMLITH